MGAHHGLHQDIWRDLFKGSDGEEVVVGAGQVGRGDQREATDMAGGGQLRNQCKAAGAGEAPTLQLALLPYKCPCCRPLGSSLGESHAHLHR